MMLMFAITTALSAGLLFVVQPMVSKTLLPVLGGVPSVWNTCLVFFQSMVLLGYGYAHIVASRLWGLPLAFRGFAVVAGAGYPQCYTAPETSWIDLT